MILVILDLSIADEASTIFDSGERPPKPAAPHHRSHFQRDLTTSVKAAPRRRTRPIGERGFHS